MERKSFNHGLHLLHDYDKPLVPNLTEDRPLPESIMGPMKYMEFILHPMLLKYRWIRNLGKRFL